MVCNGSVRLATLAASPQRSVCVSVLVVVHAEVLHRKVVLMIVVVETVVEKWLHRRSLGRLRLTTPH